MGSSANQRAHWSNRLSFILAAVGSAIGLGNIWKFPYIAGVNGGGAFVLVYLACVALVGIPILIAEIYIGQASQKNAVEAFEALHKKKSAWRAVGALGVISAFLILSFYSVVGGWVLDFAFRSGLNQFAGHSDAEIKGVLGALFSNPYRQTFCHFVFMAFTVGIVMGGIKKGIERASKILMPLLFLILIVLLVRAFFLPGFQDSLKFLFSYDASKLTAAGVLEAVGHSFFTLSLGMGAMLTYGSYLDKNENLVKVSVAISLADTLVALLAGIIIFAVVFSYGLQPDKGPSLMFQTLPMLFAKMTGGYFIAVAFFILVAFAALTSSISLLEVVVTYWEEKHKVKRYKTAFWSGFVIFLLGILAVLSTNVLANFKILGMTFFDLFDKTTSHIFLPLGGLFISLFFGWVLGPKVVEAVVQRHYNQRFLSVCLLWIVRVIAPLAVAIVFVNSLLNW